MQRLISDDQPAIFLEHFKWFLPMSTTLTGYTLSPLWYWDSFGRISCRLKHNAAAVVQGGSRGADGTRCRVRKRRQRMDVREQGYIDVGDGRVWYESAGTGDRTLLLLHGGPGGNSEDLAPFLDLAAEGFRVVRYDQLGSWRSDKPDDLSLWQVPRFVAEVEKVRQALDLGQMHLLGQSWGAFLAIEYALHHGQHLQSLTLASGAASTRECVAGMNFWRRELPRETQAITGAP